MVSHKLAWDYGAPAMEGVGAPLLLPALTLSHVHVSVPVCRTFFMNQKHLG